MAGVSQSWNDARGNALTGARAWLSPQGLRGAALEIAWGTTHLALYPWGLVEQRARQQTQRFTVANLPPAQRGLVVGDVEAAGTPILLIHGMVDNRSIFALLSHQLRRRGFGRVLALNYSPLSGDVRQVAQRLEELVERVCEDTGYERLHVIGHSMGGIVGRYYVQRLGGDDRVHTLVTLGTPHTGTRTAHLIPHPLGRQLRPGSEVLSELAGPAPGCRTRLVSIWSDLDQLILPRSAATLEHADLRVRNVLVPGVGHMSLPVDGRVVHEISTTLAQLDRDGSTTHAGVTTLTARTRRPTVRKQGQTSLRVVAPTRSVDGITPCLAQSSGVTHRLFAPDARSLLPSGRCVRPGGGHVRSPSILEFGHATPSGTSRSPAPQTTAHSGRLCLLPSRVLPSLSAPIPLIMRSPTSRRPTSTQRQRRTQFR